MIIVYVCLWFVCGLIGGGMLFADVQGSFPSIAQKNKRSDLGMSILFSFYGPIVLFIGFFMSGFCEHGWWFWGRKK